MRPVVKCVMILACLMAVSHQATYQPHQSPWLQFPHPYFLGPSSGYQQLQRAAYLKGFYDAGRLGVSPSWLHNRDMVLHDAEQSALSDAQARFRSPLIQQSSNLNIEKEDDQLARFLYNGINVSYLWKTVFTFSTSTITLCFLSSCIPATQFTAGASNIICRRRRDADADSVADIEPSHVEKVEPTPFAVLEDPNFQPIPRGREITINKVPVLDSSFDEPDSSLLPDPTPAGREKRFLYLLTTTLTSFLVYSSTYTTTIQPATAAGSLTCRPSGIGLC